VSSVHNWQSSGSFYLWRYLENSRNYPGWHFAADQNGSVALKRLLVALNKDKKSQFRTAPLSSPKTGVLGIPNNQLRGKPARLETREKVRFTYRSGEPDAWGISVQNDYLDWSFGENTSQLIVSVLDDPLHHFDATFGRSPAVWWWGHC